MKKENFLDSNKVSLEEKVKENKLKLLNLRADVEQRKLKNVKEVLFIRKDTARMLTALQVKIKEEVVAAKLTEIERGGSLVSHRGPK